MTTIDDFCREAALGGHLLLQMLVGATAILLVAGAVAGLMRSRSAAWRHRVWTLSMAALLALPVLTLLLPDLGPAWPLTDFPADDAPAAVAQPDPLSVQVASTGAGDARRREANEPPGQYDAEAHRSHTLREFHDDAPQNVTITTVLTAGDHQASSAADRAAPDDALPGEAATTRSRAGSWLWAGFFAIWLAGVAVGSCIFAGCRLAASRIVRRAVPQTEPAIIELKEQLCRSAGIGLSVPLLCSSEIAVPLTTGCRRPVIVLPAGYGQWTTERCRVVLAHEIAHIRRRDLLSQLIARLVCVIYWCHPLVWLASWRMRVEREFACDDAVLETGEVPGRYAGHLVDVAAALLNRSRPPRHAVPMASRSNLEQRVQVILQPSVNRSPVTRRSGWMLAAVALALAALVGLMSPATNQDASFVANADDGAIVAPTPDSPQPQPKKAIVAAAGNAATDKEESRKTVIVRGVVVDGSGQPVPSATVTADGFFEKITDTADGLGEFAMEIPSERVPPGLLLIASSPDQSLGYVQLPWEHDIAEENLPQRITLGPPRMIDVKVVDGEAKSVGGAKVVVITRGRTIAQTTTDKEGRGSLAVPKDLPLGFVLVKAAGVGLDYVLFQSPDLPKRDPFHLPQDHSGEIALALSPTRSLTVRAVDQNGRPIRGAQVNPWYVTLPRKGGYANLGWLWAKDTDDNGVATCDNIPVENEGTITIWVSKEGFVAKDRTIVDAGTSDDVVTATLLPLVPVTGRAVLPDGSSAAGIEVAVAGTGYGMDRYLEATTTSDDGIFHFNAYPDNYCLFVAGNDQWASPVETRVVLLGKPVEGIELKLRPATRVFGRLTAGDDHEPQTGEYVQLYQLDSADGNAYYALPEEDQLPNPTDSRQAITPRIVRNVLTDEEGRFEFHVGPGGYYLMGPRGARKSIFAVTDEKELEFNLQAKRELKGTLKGRVVLQSNPDQGVAEVRVFSYSEDLGSGTIQATTDEQGRFEARRAPAAQLVGAFRDDGKLGAIVRLEAGAESALLPLAPTAVLRGILIDDETGQPAANRQVGASIRVDDMNGTSFMHAFRRGDTTDDAGRFEIAGVVPGHSYELAVVVEQDKDGSPRSWRKVSTVKPEQAETVELGEVRLPAPYRPPTLEDHIARAFDDRGDLSARIARLLNDAKLAYQQVLVVVADPKSQATRQFFELRHDRSRANDELQVEFGNYMVCGIDVKQTAILEDLGIAAPDKEGARLALLDPDRRVVAAATVDALAVDGKLDRDRLTEFLTRRRAPLADAATELAAALAAASREDKRVLVQVSGPGCAPCILLARYLDRQHELVTKDYIWLKLDSRMPNADDVIGKLREKAEGGIPWMVILSADGKTLITSDSDEGNIGYPVGKAEKSHFEHMLRTTRQRLSDADISALLAGLGE